MTDSRNAETPKQILLADYRPPAFLVDSLSLDFQLYETDTCVRSVLRCRRNPLAQERGPLVLDGHDMRLVEISLDGRVLAESDYTLGEETLTIDQVPDSFELRITSEIQPQNNTALEGLYKSGGNFCTQCEAQGFRRITFYPDRPDVMTVFDVRIEADREHYPVLLSNGNRVEAGELDNGRHWVQWQDPWPKPSYLFALVAGDLTRVSDSFTTMHGRQVSLELYVQHHNREKCAHALASLQKAMLWDEQVYGREYDLDLYMIVAVDDFNMGAMENKGLNVFNSSCVLALPDTATDADYSNIERIVAHEYFHNWSGNRVTCRDWFQLSLKEGFTVYRDQEFSADMTSRAVKRIADVNILRSHQFREDGGPMAHPVRPPSYVEINNFYTLTVYNKGAEVVRMIRELLGEHGFRRGSDLYFARHDGQAVTTDDFVNAMEEAGGVDLTQFRRWYGQAGTPKLEAAGRYDAQGRRYELTIRQSCPPTPESDTKLPFHIPVRMALLGPDGTALPTRLAGEDQPVQGDRVLGVTEAEQVFEFVDVPARPVPSLLRDFSAPVKLHSDLSRADKLFLMSHDDNAFNRWDVGQGIMVEEILRLLPLVAAGETPRVDQEIIDALARTLQDERLDHALIAQAVSLPSMDYIADFIERTDPVALFHTRRLFCRQFQQACSRELLACYRSLYEEGEYRIDAASMGRRALANTCLSLLMEGGEDEIAGLCLHQYRHATNMTDRLAAFALLIHHGHPDSEAILEDFWQRWRHDAQVVEKWLRVQSMNPTPDALQRVRALLDHEGFSFTNPNKLRAVIGGFSANAVAFHHQDGSGYAFVADQVLRLNDSNPLMAARLVSVFSQWRRFDERRSEMMQRELQRIAGREGLSRDVYEIVSRSL